MNVLYNSLLVNAAAILLGYYILSENIDVIYITIMGLLLPRKWFIIQ